MSKTAEDYKNEGNNLLRQKKFLEALDKYTEGIKVDGNNHVLFSNRSLCQLQLGKFEEAIKDASECIRIKPDWFKGYLRRVSVYQKQNILHEALSTLEKGIQACTEGKEKLTSLFQSITQSLLTNPKEQHQLECFQVHKLFSVPDFEKEFISMHPAYAKDLLKQPMFRTKIEKIQESTTECLTFLKDQQVKLAIGILTGQVARQERERELKMKREAAEDEKRRQKVREKEREKKEKLENLKKKEDEKPENREKLKGNEYFRKREFEKAIEHYNKALELNENECSFYFNLSACYLELKEYEKSLEKAQKGLELGKKTSSDEDPLIFTKIAKGYARMGNVYFRQKEFEKALECFKDSMTESKSKLVSKKITECKSQIQKAKDMEYYDADKAGEAKQKGNHEFRNKQFSAAIPHYREAIKRNPKDPSLHLNMGTCYLKMGQFPTAIKEFEKSIELNPKYEKAYNRYAQCYIQHFMIMSPQQKGSEGFNLLMKASQVVAKGFKNCGQDSRILNDAMKTIYQYMSLFQQKN